MRLAFSLVSASAAAAMFAPALSAQLVIGATAGAARYDSQSTTTSLAVNPEFRYERRGLVLDLGGGYTAGSDGGRVGEGGGTLWAATLPTDHHIQLDGLFQVGLNRPQGDSSSSSLFGLGEVAYALADRGVAVGVGTVQATIAGSATVGAFRAELRGWRQVMDGDLTVTGSIEPTRLAGAWFTEFAAGAEWTPGAWDVSGGLRLRQVSGAGTSLGGGASAAFDFTPRWTVELDAGRYLRDPYQGLPEGYFVSLGVKLKIATWKSGTGDGVGAANLGDVSLRAAERSFGFARNGNSGPGSGSGTSGTSGRTTSPGNSSSGRGHKP
jgi:hypothetical protein